MFDTLKCVSKIGAAKVGVTPQDPRGESVTPRPNESDRLAVFVGSFGGCGFFPWAPATLASAVATPILAWIYPLPEALAYAGLLTFLSLAGVWSATRMERIYGHDPSAVVLDEVLGMAIALAAMPITLATCVLAFLFFRVFDILKLWPGRALERLPHGWGVMADDACAGVYAWIALRLVLARVAGAALRRLAGAAGGGCGGIAPRVPQTSPAPLRQTALRSAHRVHLHTRSSTRSRRALVSIEVLAVGDELLSGATLDTNSQWIARTLFERGLDLARVTMVGDAPEPLADAFAAALGRARAVIVTGGLGPTLDDRTKEIVAAYLGDPLELDAAVLEDIRARFARRGMVMPEVNVKQAFLPRGGTKIPNPVGSAPGVHWERDGREVFLLPGVPREMQSMMEATVLPRLVALFPVVAQRRGVFRTVGLPESELAQRLMPLTSTTPTVGWAFYPGDRGGGRALAEFARRRGLGCGVRRRAVRGRRLHL